MPAKVHEAEIILVLIFNVTKRMWEETYFKGTETGHSSNKSWFRLTFYFFKSSINMSLRDLSKLDRWYKTSGINERVRIIKKRKKLLC